MASMWKSVTYVVLITGLFSLTESQEDGEEIPRIGIIGAGVGGTTTAYYLRQLFGKEAVIDIFEQDRVGGRARSINIDDFEYEAGAAVLHPLNEYMVNFTNMFGLERIDASEGRIGFFGSDGMKVETSTWTAVTMAKLLWRYGYDIVKIQNWVQDSLLKNFTRIYKLQNEGIAFTTVEDMLQVMDPEFVRYTHTTIMDVMKEQGFSDIFIKEMVHAIMRNNYGQSVAIPAFVGAVSMAGAQPGLWAVKGGNKQVPEKLLKKSKANLINGKVTQILLQKDGEGVTYEVSYKNPDPESKDQEENAREYDIVVIATPLPTGQTNIKFEDFTQHLPLPDLKLHETIALFVQGYLNASYFGYENLKDMPNGIFTVDEDVFFNSVGKQRPVSFKEHLKKKDVEEEVYKVFLNRVPTEQEVRLLFSGRKDLRLINWKAYPQYSTNMELPPFVLYDRLYNVNAVEIAASALEMSAIGGRNVALLAYNHWYGHLDKIDEVSESDAPSVKQEL
ncbi:prenylcysteine oxidase-like isoform X1 [Haliotis rufescens]|uniref:prenylcysteine oxidase-like isoform X1 n=2 Tax=Haliotis rufescens TaxID=6454 RepID=UPI00201EA6D1|nr:prenylcysteine oxidase-like isoform X1 [Haliotis rufescens]